MNRATEKGITLWRPWVIALVLGLAPPGCHHQGQVHIDDPTDVAVTAESGGDEGSASAAAHTTEEWVHAPVRILNPTEGDPTVLDESTRAMLRELAESVRHRSDVDRIRIEGHDDSRGDSEANRQRARARAGAMVDYLVNELDMPRELFEIVSYGDSRPITSDTSAADRVQNRRVEFSLLVRRPSADGSMPPQPAYSPPPPVAAPVASTPTFTPAPAPPVQPSPIPSPPASQPVMIVPQLTATSVGDVDRRGPYLSYLSRHSSEATQIDLDMSRRVRFRVLDQRSLPVHDAVISFNAGGQRVEGRTHADGYWDFFPGVSAPRAQGQSRVTVRWSNHQAHVDVPIPNVEDGRDVTIQLPQAISPPTTTLDLAFAIDVTGSMGDELTYIADEVAGIVSRVQGAVEQTHVRVGAIFYRDRSDMTPLNQIQFTNHVDHFIRQTRSITAGGGGDYPEDMNTGLNAALNQLHWSRGRAVRVLVVIADAPPQQYPDANYTYHHAMADASRRGIRILPVAASGADRVVEYLFRAMGAYTSTPYVYLTDDSGIGGHHMEADTDRISVEMFSDLLTRMLISDLQGQGMHEPSHAGQGMITVGMAP